MLKKYLTADQLLQDSYRLALDIVESGFKPTFLLAVWRGGAPIGIAIQEVLEVCGISVNHIAVRTSYYTAPAQRARRVRVHGLGYVVDTLGANDRLLIVDDVHDSGRSVEALVDRIQRECGPNTPTEIKLATPYYKPSKSEVATAPDFYLHEVEDWLVFPHELQGLSKEELLESKPASEENKHRLLNLIEHSLADK